MANPINSSFDDFGYVINAKKNGYFSSNRGADKLDDIFAFIEKRTFELPIFLEIDGFTTDSETNKYITEAEITLFNKESNIEEVVMSNINGGYKFSDIDIALVDYIQVKKQGYLTANISLDYEKLANKNSTINIKLTPVMPDLSKTIAVNFYLKHKNSNGLDLGIANALVTLLDINKNVIATGKTNQEGSLYMDNIARKDIAFVRIEKDGYLTEEIDVDANRIKGDDLKLNISLSKSRIANEEGADIASILNTIYFNFGKSTIRDDAKIELEKIVEVLSKFPDIKIEIRSHTDSKSSSSFNQKLSQDRAKSTYQYLVSRGISSSRLAYNGFGESKLINKCKDRVECTEEEHQENRRSEFIIVAKDL